MYNNFSGWSTDGGVDVLYAVLRGDMVLDLILHRGLFLLILDIVPLIVDYFRIDYHKRNNSNEPIEGIPIS